MRSLILPLFVVGIAIAGCDRTPDVVEPDSPLASEVKLLDRQVSSLRTAIADAKQGALFASSDLAVSVSEEALQKAVSQAFPLEASVSDDFRARIDRAVVSFRSMQGSVRLEGRVWTVADPGTYADLTLLGGIPEVNVDEATGTLTAAIVLDGWDVQRAAAAGAEMDWIKSVVRLLGERGLASLRDLVPAVRIPVGLEKEIDLPAVEGGAVTIPAGRLPLEAKVVQVLPLSGRLWAMIQVSTSGWERVAARAPASPPSKRGPGSQTQGPGRGARAMALAPSPDRPVVAASPLTTAQTRRTIQTLKAEMTRLQGELRSVLPDDAKLLDAPSGDVLIGLPSALVERIVSEALLGPLRNVRLFLKDVAKLQLADQIEAKTFLGQMTLGNYALTVDVQEVTAMMKPKTPKLTFGSNRILIDLPVSVEAGRVKAKLIFKWDGQNIAGMVCGDLSGEHDLRATIPPVAVRVHGRFDVVAKGERVIVSPRIEPIRLAFQVEPPQQTWDYVDDLIESKNGVCEAALRKAQVGQKVKDLVSRGFQVNVPTNWLHALALPASFRNTVDVQGTTAGLAITPTAVSITQTRIWYGANLAVRKGASPLRRSSTPPQG